MRRDICGIFMAKKWEVKEPAKEREESSKKENESRGMPIKPMKETFLRQVGKIFWAFQLIITLLCYLFLIYTFFGGGEGSSSLCEGLIFKSLAEKTGFQCSLCYEYIMFYAFQEPHFFFSYEIYLYSLPKAHLFSLDYSWKDLKIGAQVRVSVSDVLPHTVHDLDIIVTRRTSTTWEPTFSWLFFSSPSNLFLHFLTRSTSAKTFWKQVICLYLKNQLLIMQVNWNQLIEHKK